MAGEITARLTLDGENFTAEITGARRHLEQFYNSINKLSPKLDENERKVRHWGKSFRDSIIVLALARDALNNINDLFLSLPRAIVNSAAEIERMTALMSGLSRETESYSKIAEKAKEDLRFNIDLSQASPFNLQTVTDAFVKFRSVGIDPTTGSLQALVDGVAKFGGTSDQLKRASIAIQQMAGKGVVSMEELRQQLGEAVPTAIDMMARATGMSMRQLVKVVSSGTLEAKSAMDAMLNEMEIQSQYAAAQMANTWSGLVERLKTELMWLGTEAGAGGGFFEGLKETLRDVIFLLRSPEAMQAAQQLGSALATMAQGLVGATTFLYQNADAIIAVATAYGIYRAGIAAATPVMRQWSTIVRNHTKLTDELRDKIESQLIHQMGHFSYAIRDQATQMARAQATALTLRNTIQGLGSALYQLAGGGFGVAVAAGTALWYLWDKLRDKHEELIAELSRTAPIHYTADQRQRLQEDIEKLKEKAEAAKRVAEAMRNGSYWQMREEHLRGVDYKPLTEEERLQQMQRWVDEYESLQKQIVKQTADLNLALDAEADRRANIAVETLKLQMAKRFQPLINAYEQNVAQFRETLKDRSDKEAEELRKDNLKSERQKLFDAQAKIYQDEYDRLNKIILSGLEDEKEINAERRQEISKQIEWLEREMESAKTRLEFSSPYELLTDKGEGAAQGRLDAYILSMERKLAKFKGKIEDENPYQAEFEAMRNGGLYADIAADKLERVEKLLKDVWEAEKKWNDEKRESVALTNSLNEVANTLRSIDNAFERRTNINPFMTHIIAADAYRRKLNELKRNIEGLSIAGNPEAVAGLKRIEEALKELDTNVAQASTNDFIKNAAEIEEKLLPSYRRAEVEHQRIIDQLQEWRRAAGELTFEQELAFQRYVEALNAQALREMELPFGRLLRTWSDTTEGMSQIWANTMEGFVDTLTDGLIEGEYKFRDFFNEIGKQFLKLQLQSAAAGLVTGVNAGIMNWLAGGSTPGSSISDYTGSAFSEWVSSFATGGIMTGNGPLPIEKYARGGVAYRPQLAIFGEGSQPEAFVPLPDGRRIPVSLDMAGTTSSAPPSVQVNLINQSGDRLEADSVEPRWDGHQMILDVVLAASSRPGKFRDGLRSNLR